MEQLPNINFKKFERTLMSHTENLLLKISITDHYITQRKRTSTCKNGQKITTQTVAIADSRKTTFTIYKLRKNKKDSDTLSNNTYKTVRTTLYPATIFAHLKRLKHK